MPTTLSHQCPWMSTSASQRVAELAGCQGEWHSADRVYDTRATGLVATEDRASVLQLPHSEFRIPGILKKQGTRARWTGLQQPIDASPLSALTRTA